MSGMRSTVFQAAAAPVFRARLRAVVGGPGAGEGQIGNAAALTVLSDGNIAITDTSNKRVQVFDLHGNLVRVCGAKVLTSPWGVAAIKDKFYVTDGGQENKVHIFHNDGRPARYFHALGLLEACCIAVSPKSGNIVVTDLASPEIAVYHPDNFSLLHTFQAAPLAGQEERPIPEHIAISGFNNIFLSFGAQAPSVHKYNMEGELIAAFGSFGCPSGVHVTAKNSVLVLDREKRTLAVYNVDGVVQQQLLNSSNGLSLYPHSVAVAGGKTLVVVGSPEPHGMPCKIAIYALQA